MNEFEPKWNQGPEAGKSREEKFKEELKKLGILDKLGPFQQMRFVNNIHEISGSGRSHTPDFENSSYRIYREFDENASPKVYILFILEKRA